MKMKMTAIRDFDWRSNEMEMRTVTCRNHPTAVYVTKHPTLRTLHFSQWAEEWLDPKVDKSGWSPLGECPCPFDDLVVVE